MGNWFRYGDFIMHKNGLGLYAIYENGIEKYGRFEIAKDNPELKPLETLTPKEALILLANGFVLKHLKREHLIKVDDEGVLMALFKDEKRFSPLPIVKFKGFTIHALPKEAGQCGSE